MKTRSIIGLLLCLLLAAGIWLLWPRQTRPAHPPGFATGLAPALAATTPTTPTTNSVHVQTANTSVLSTNKLSLRLANTTKTIGELERHKHAILLENAFIDTDLNQSLKIPTQLHHNDDPGAYIVQARRSADAEFRSLLSWAGAQVISYIPNNAYLVRISASGAGSLAGSPLVQAVLPYEPYYKVQTSLLQLAVDQKPLPGGTVLTLGLFANTAAATEAQIESMGGTVVGRDRSPFGPILRVKPPVDWIALAQLSGVQIVEVANRRRAANDLSRVNLGISVDTVTNANYLNLSGSNVVVEVNDSGIDATHPDFTLGGSPATGQGGAPIRVIGDSPLSLVDTNGHGTHVAGIIAGNGDESWGKDGTPSVNVGAVASGSITNADFRGKAPLATLYSVAGIDGGYDTFYISDYYLQSVAAQTNALISNNSWGNGDGYYDLAAASYDAATRDALPLLPGSQPVLFVFSAGNDGGGGNGGFGGSGDTITAPGTAKDVITVGALEQLRNITNIVTDAYSNQAAVWQPETDSSSQVAGFSSRGNVGIGTEGTYGRFKPDVVAPGTFVVSTRSSQWNTNVYYNPTNDETLSFTDQTVTTNTLNYYNVTVPANAVGVVISITANNNTTVFPTNLPIYVMQSGIPTTNSFDFFTTYNGVTIPSDGGAGYLQTIQNSGFWFGVGDSTNVSVNYNVTVDIYTTNNYGNYYPVLEGLNDSLGQFYRYESGTSMAAAGVSGMLALIQDYFTNTLHSLPSPALMKALLINGSRPVGNYTYSVTNGINFQGWGQPNIVNSLPYSTGTNTTVSTNGPIFFVDQSPTNALATGDSHTYIITLDTNNYAEYLPLQVTLAWTDPAGNPAAAIKLVNNLDLVVTNLDTGDVFFGNDFAGGVTYNNPWVTNAAPNLDMINNVENVFLSPLLGSSYSITVVGRDVNVNAVTAQTNNVVQDFALVVTCGEGEVPTAITSVTDSGIVSQPTSDQQITFVTTTNTPLYNQFAGENSPLLGTNNLPIGPNTIWGTNGALTVGMTNQWHFYVITNTGLTSDVTNAAFITFLPGTLSIPRIGVFADSLADSTRTEADIDLFATTDPNLTNLSPVTISNCVYNVGDNHASLTRDGTEFVYFIDSAPGTVYYVGVKSEDHMGSEYDFMPIFTSTPFSQNDHGNLLANGLLLPKQIPDGNNAHPGVTNVFALAIPALGGLDPGMTVAKVTITNLIEHQNYGDLYGAISFSGTTVIMNNHAGLHNTVGSQPRVYDDSRNANTNYSVHSDGPGSNLRNYIGKTALGPWIQYQADEALTHTGQISAFSLEIQPHKNFKHPGITVTVPAGGWFIDYVDVPVGFETLNLYATNTTAPYATQAIQMYEKFGDQPTFTDYDQEQNLTNCLPNTGPFPVGTYPGNSISTGPPLPMGLYYLGLYNPNSVDQQVFISYDLIPVPVIAYYTTNGVATTIADDAVTDSSVFITSTQQIAAASVGMVINTTRLSDLAITLVNQTTGQRVLLMENRGGTDTNNAGAQFVYTNIVNGTATGGDQPDTNTLNTGVTAGSVQINYNFYDVPDEMTVYYGTNITPANLVLDTGMINNPGNVWATITATYPPATATTVSTILTIIMNQFGNTNGLQGDRWDYVVGAPVTNYQYLTFTEDTNLATVPIKYGIPPFETPDAGTNYTLSDFEASTNGTYFGPTNIFDPMGGWTVPTNAYVYSYILTNSSLVLVTNTVYLTNNEVSVVTDPDTAFGGSNCLALANGTITRTIPTVPGRQYNITYWYRGPGIDGWWRGEGNATDSSDPENNANNGSLIGRFTFPGGEVGQAFGTVNPGQLYVYAGTNAYVQIPQPPTTISTTVGTNTVLVQTSPLDVGTGPGFTVEGWFNPTNTGIAQPLVEWLARVPTNALVTNLVITAGPFLSPVNSHYYYLLGTTNLTTSEYWAQQLGGHLATVRNANEENWIFDQFGNYGNLNRNLWIGLTNSAAGFGWLSGETNAYRDWQAGQPLNTDGTRNYTGILGATNRYAGLWTATDNRGFVYGSTATNCFYGVVEVPDIQTNGVQFWFSVTNGVALTNGSLYANLIDITNGWHEITSPAGLVQTNVYQHVALTYDTNSGLARLYYNGTNVASTNLGVFIPKTTGDVLLGKDMSRLTNNFFTGEMDEFSIYARQLSGAEIAAIYNSSALTTNRNAGKFDASVTPAAGLAEAMVTIGGATNLIYGVNKTWEMGSYTFTATTNSIPVQITGIEPGILLDTFTVTEAALTNIYYLPEESLQPLVGDSAYGQWTLEIWDNRVGGYITGNGSATNAQLVSWQLQFTVQTNPPVTLSPQGLVTNTVPAGQITYFAVTAPAWASYATNILVSASAPVDLLYNQTNEPSGLNPGDYEILTNSTGGIGVPVLTTNNIAPTFPPLIPGQTYYLGVRNNGSAAATVVLAVDFDMVTLTNSLPFSGILTTNSSDAERYYAFDVTTNAYEATFQLLKLSANADLVVSRGTPLPTLTNAAYGSFNDTNANEIVYVLTNSAPVPLSAGRWYLGVIRRDAGPVNYSVLAKELDTPAPAVINLTNNVPFTFTIGSGADLTNFFHFQVTNSPASIHFELYDMTGNGDLTVQTNALPLAPVFFQSSQEPGQIPEFIYFRTNSALTNLANDWYLGVPNNETNPITCTILAVIDTNAAFAAFPGAEGAGGAAIGGRTGTVYHVTSLADSGLGTLRDAVGSTNRTVVFDVSGVIFLRSPLLITNSYLTIAGQSAPAGKLNVFTNSGLAGSYASLYDQSFLGAGITVFGQMTTVAAAHDVIIRDVRFRRGAPDDSLQLTNVANVIADHVSVEWSSDNAMSVLNSSNVTVQWSMVSDSIYLTNSPQGIGSLLRYGNGLLSLSHNLYADNYSGSPQLGDNLSLDFVNNVIYNWGLYSGLSDGIGDLAANPGGFTNELNYVGNYLIAGADTAAFATNYAITNIAFFGGTTNTWLFQTNNLIDSDNNGVLNGAYTKWGMFTNKYTGFSQAFSQLPPVTTDEPFLGYEKVMDFAGVNMDKRDLVDTNLAVKVRTQTGRLVSTPLLSGLVAWWRGEGNVLDSIGTNNGTALNVTYAAGEVNQGMAFNGNNSKVSVAVSPSLNLTNGTGLTLALWIKPAAMTNWVEELMEWNNNSGSIGTHLESGLAYNGGFAAEIIDTSLVRHQINSPQNLITTNQFQLLALTYDKASGVCALSRNGITVVTANFGAFTILTNYPFFLGMRPSGSFSDWPDGRYSGLMDEVMIFKRGLSSNEVATLYNEGASGLFSYNCSALPYLDTDQDGIPDFWENTFGTDPFTPSNNKDRNGDGYTDLEEYNNWVAGLHALTITNTPVGVDLKKLFGQTGNLSFAVTNGTNGTVYLTNVVGSVTNTGTYSNSVAIFTPVSKAIVGTNFYGYASFGVIVTNNDTLAHFGPVPVSVVVSAVPIAYNSNGSPVIITLTNALPYTNANASGSDYYRFTVTNNPRGVVFQALNPSGNVALVARYGLPLPALNLYDYISANPGTANQNIVVLTNSTPVALTNGDWYLAVVNVSGGPVTYSAKATMFTNVIPPLFLYPTNTTVTNVVESAPNQIACVATDLDVPPLPLGYYLVSAPGNMLINPLTGLINWTPTVAQGRSTNIISVCVTNIGYSVTNTFTVIVLESNLPPVFPPPGNQVVIPPASLQVTNAAIDLNVPPNPLTYSLLFAPTNALIDTNGVITWTPGAGQPPGNYLFTTVVTDNDPWAVNAQSMSVTNSFYVSVVAGLAPGVPQTNTVPPNGITWYAVQVPYNAIIATNSLLFATLPVNLWYSTNIPPSVTNSARGDYELLNNQTSGVAVFGVTNTVPVLVPGGLYFLGIQNTNSVTITNAVEVTFDTVTPPVLPNIPSQVIAAGDTLVITNRAIDTNAGTLFYTFTNSLALTAPAITTNGIIAWATTTNDANETVLFNTSVTNAGTGLGTANRFTVTVLPSIIIGPPLTNVVGSNSISWYLVKVPANAVAATNSLLFATLPLNLWYSTNVPPSITNYAGGDFELLTNVTSGADVFGVTNTVPVLVPGARYFLGVQNTNAIGVTNVIQVTFSLVPPPVYLSSIVSANYGTTNGYLLTWYAPTNDQFHVQWSPAVAPTRWLSITGVVSYSKFITGTNSQFTFFDDGTRTAGLDPVRFYRLQLLNSPTNTAPYFLQGTPADRYVTPSTTMTVNNTAGDWDLPAQGLLYSITNTLPGVTGAYVGGNYVITWTPTSAQRGLTNVITTVVTDNGVPAKSVTNSFSVIVTNAPVYPMPVISSVVVSNGQVSLQWSGSTNEQFNVRWATNLNPPVAWTSFGVTITSTNGVFKFVDTNAPLLMKFYQLLVP